MIFKRSRNRYGETPEPVTPYQKAAQIWDERLGSARVQARNWRLAAFGALGLSLILSGGVIWQAGQSKVVPYIVELDTDGAARPVRAATGTYAPTDAQIAYHLARFIEKVRSLPTDPIVVRRNWLQAYDFATARASNTLNSWARDNNPFAKVGRESVAVNVTSVVRASPSSFQIRWRERRYLNGSLASTKSWTALAMVAIDPPGDLDTLRKNPLGIYVTALNWSQELDGSPSRQTGEETLSPNAARKREERPVSTVRGETLPDASPPKPDLPAITDPLTDGEIQ